MDRRRAAELLQSRHARCHARRRCNRSPSHCDGVRCDMAMLVFNDVFDRTWRRLLRDRWPDSVDGILARDNPDDSAADLSRRGVLESRGSNARRRASTLPTTSGFSTRCTPRTGHSDRRDLLAASDPDPHRLCRFLENHDEPRSAAVLGEQLPAALSVLATIPGMRFFFDGQREGRRLRTPVQLGRWPDEAGDSRIQASVRPRPRLRRASRASRGRLAHTERVGRRRRHAGQISSRIAGALEDALAVIVVNLGDITSQAHVDVAADLPAGARVRFRRSADGRDVSLGAGRLVRDRAVGAVGGRPGSPVYRAPGLDCPATHLSSQKLDGARDETSQRTASHHRDCRACPGEPRLLRRRARHAARQEERQPGRSRNVSPVLCRCRRTARHGSHVFSVGPDGASARRVTDLPSKSDSKCPAAACHSGAPAAKSTARASTHRDTVRRARPAVDRSSRLATRARRSGVMRDVRLPHGKTARSTRTRQIRGLHQRPSCGSGTKRRLRSSSRPCSGSNGSAPKTAGRVMGSRTRGGASTFAKLATSRAARGALAPSITSRGASTTTSTSSR